MLGDCLVLVVVALSIPMVLRSCFEQLLKMPAQFIPGSVVCSSKDSSSQAAPGSFWVKLSIMSGRVFSRCQHAVFCVQEFFRRAQRLECLSRATKPICNVATGAAVLDVFGDGFHLQRRSVTLFVRLVKTLVFKTEREKG